jgi:hypothetical protein
VSDDYQRRSYGAIPVGTGEKPGIVVVDFQLGFTDPQYPLGGAPLVMSLSAMLFPRSTGDSVRGLPTARQCQNDDA